MTTYTFKCSDMGMQCPFSVTAESREIVKKYADMHAMETHADMIASMTDEQKAEMETKKDSVITEASM